MIVNEWESPIEIQLSHDVAEYYYLRWRYKCVAKIFGISIPGRWHYPLKYEPVLFQGDNPDGLFRWSNIIFNLKNKDHVQRYARLKDSIKTKVDLWKEFDLKRGYDRYERNLEAYYRHLDEYDQNIKTIKEIDSNKN